MTILLKELRVQGSFTYVNKFDEMRIAGLGGLMGGVGAVHGPAQGGPATGRNPTVRSGSPASAQPG
jgi:hypothetical protein